MIVTPRDRVNGRILLFFSAESLIVGNPHFSHFFSSMFLGITTEDGAKTIYDLESKKKVVPADAAAAATPKLAA